LGLTEVVQQAQALTNASGAALALVTEREDQIECCARSGRTAPPIGRVSVTEDSLTSICLRSAQRLLCDDAETDPRVRSTAIVSLGVRSLAPLDPHHRRTEIVGAVLLGNAANLPEASFQPLGQGFKALRKANLDGFDVGVGQDQMVKQMRERDAGQGDAEVIHVRKVGLRQNAGVMDLLEGDVLGRAVVRAPSRDMALEGAQLAWLVAIGCVLSEFGE